MKLSEILELVDFFKNKSKHSTNPLMGKHCIIRTYSAGVHMGILEFQEGTEVMLTKSRRIWKWGNNAFTLSEVAQNGINPSNSRIAQEIPEIYLTQAIEIIPTTQAARETFEKCHE